MPCDTAALASAISGASSGDTLVLAAGCTYHVTGPLPEISTNLSITATSITGNTASLGGAAGGIENHGTVHLHRDTIQSNTPVNCSNVPGCTG